jgi:hypothetical protein
MRWTLLAIAIAVGACGKDKGDQAAHSDAATPVDTAMTATPTPADTVHAAVTTDTAAPKRAQTSTKSAVKSTPAKSSSGATAPAAPSGTTASPGSNVSGAQAMMGVVASGTPKTLSKDQVKQLQAALKKQGCYDGTPDGMTGPGTQAAIECGLQKYKLTANNMSGLYQKLGLKF